MGRALTLERLEWSNENFELAKEAVLQNLSKEYLPKYRWKKNDECPVYGHCHTASGALYMLFGPEHLEIWRGQDLYKPHRSHFWIVRKDTGEIVDLTVAQYEQYGDQYPYEGRKSTLLSWHLYYFAKDVYQKAMNDVLRRNQERAS